MDLVFRTGKQFKLGEFEFPKLEAETQTDIDWDGFEYMAQATAMQEQLQKGDKYVKDRTPKAKESSPPQSFGVEAIKKTISSFAAQKV